MTPGQKALNESNIVKAHDHVKFAMYKEYIY